MSSGPTSCGCKAKCLAEIPYYGDLIRTYSPKCAATILMANRRGMKYPKSFITLWAYANEKWKTESEDHIEAIHHFAHCANILKYSSEHGWKEEAAKVKMDITDLEYKEFLNIRVRLIDGTYEKIQITEFETVHRLKLKIDNGNGIECHLSFGGEIMVDHKFLTDYPNLKYDPEVIQQIAY
ncbi:unnamed protein product [Caenorhabditis angaria]|uniref:Uncharacterized protein n=1 Tax=Caenorhabditis angaria TaxID=860376 RepID=A0A9P1ICI6_9PELO|nr:unnamed protein product [Caenorhabditis angaria]